RREGHRISLLGKVAIKAIAPEASLNGYAINISSGGLSLYSEKAFDMNTELLLTIFFKYDVGEEREDVFGVVRWIKPVGDLFAVGVQFKGIRQETHPMIFTYLDVTMNLSRPRSSVG
ncbi:MAG: PilZ domain-containing protein, partial [Nitrospirota bacterium]|nr:PilZ domain-containing protein [Nitrospirota bacterium]